ncbi:F0F1 ATP synthase subunit A [Antarcticibacterium flavum]|uniref:ATP synthase subunit a n=1 Tax=Antarcticibacterium flavum TaxID=2058175 RepID=A0A5B7X211_9FLAO|nr:MULTISPECIES: F0F1 ATP synthase subunit A [Antarcticibacterium]MCM4159186.1 ATP synthase F0 subunit A [Antarcticibacterium sp. W02-3]QCY69584.1 F0F1 ATP synthase subunit A [Antarcticibacterium flavum]
MTAQKSLKIIVTFALAILPFLSFSQEEGSAVKEASEKFNATDMIMHHIGDAHEWHFFGEGDHSYTLPLPVILYTDNGFVTFMSSNFNHDLEGQVIVEKNGMSFVNYHEKIYRLEDGETALEFGEDGYPVNAGKPWDFSITKNVAAMFITVILMLWFFFSLANYHKKNKQAPKGFNNVLESLVLFVRDDIAIPQIGEKKYMKFMPFLLTVFFFIWITNLLGLLPGAANVTGNIAVTVSLGLFTLALIFINGNKDYWKHVFWMPGIPTFVKPILAVVEVMGLFIKPIALMIRLFANITAGHIIILSLLALIFILESAGVAGISVPFALFITVLELLVAFLQAFIFTMLSALFIGMAVEEHEHH